MLSFEQIVSFDTETYGLNAYLGDLPFGFAFANSYEEYYYDDRKYSKQNIYDSCKELFEDFDRTVILHNAKFDMHMLYVWCLENSFVPIKYNAKIVCTAVMARIVNNDRINTKLKFCAKDYGLEKSDAVDIWIVKNKAYKLVNGEQQKDFSKVPYAIISNYAKKDSRVTYDLYFCLLNDLSELQKYNDTLDDGRSLYNILDREAELLKALFEVEKTGVLINTDYTRRAFGMERQRADAASERFTQITGRELVDSGKAITSALIDSGYDESKIPRTEKGNYSLTAKILSSVAHPIADVVNQYRNAAKSADTFYGGFIDLRDKSGRIHTNFRQDSTRTFRLSSSNPNLQNIPSKEVNGFFARNCFIPEENHTWVSMDYKAQEMRLLFDLSGEKTVADRINQGEDVHEVTASLMGVNRKKAKDVGFALIYGKGITQLSIDLGISYNEAKALRELFFGRMPRSKILLDKVIRKARDGFVSNKYGRIYRFKNGFEYKAPNYLIQGTGGEICKDAMINIYKIYKQDKVKIVSAVHDELNFNIHNDYLHEIDNIKKIMIDVYKPNILSMDVDVSMSTESWGKCE